MKEWKEPSVLQPWSNFDTHFKFALNSILQPLTWLWNKVGSILMLCSFRAMCLTLDCLFFFLMCLSFGFTTCNRKGQYSRACIKRHRIKWSVVKVPNLFPLNHCDFHHYLAVTSIKWSWSPLTKSQRPVFISFFTCIERSLEAEPLKQS